MQNHTIVENNRLTKCLELKTHWTANDIKLRLNTCGESGFIFHATGSESIGFAYESADYTEDTLWEQPPFIGSPIFYRNRLIGAHVISPHPPSMWARSHAGIRKFRNRSYQPSLRLAHCAGLTHVGLGALVPFATDYGRHLRNGDIRSLTTGHAGYCRSDPPAGGPPRSVAGFSPSERTYADSFGAVGSIGANVARWFAQNGAAGMVLVDTPRRGTQLASLAVELR